MLGGSSGLEVGSVFARIGALFDEDGFDRWRREIKVVREEAKRKVEANLQGDFNPRDFDQFDRAMKGARSEALKDVKPDLKGDFNDRDFNRFDRAMRDARAEARRDVSTDLKADVDETGFRKYDRALRSARNESDITTRAGVRTRAGFIGIGKSAGAAAVGFLGTYGLVEGVRKLYGAYRDSEKVGLQTEAVIRSTGEEANVSADRVGRLADKFSHLGAIDDEMVQTGENVLLTFTNIRNEVGKGNNIFDQASLSALNMSTALDQDVKSSAIQLGKALNDPIKGITALSRVGVAFTEETKERITTLTEEGHTLAAQKIILKELNTEFGGSTKAAGEGASGMDKFSVAAENLEEKIGGKLAPTLSKWASAAAEFLDSLSGSGTKQNKAAATVKRIVSDIGAELSGFRDELSAIGKNVDRFVTGIGNAFDDVFGGGSEIGRDLTTIGKALRGFEEWVLRVYGNVVKRALPGIITAFKGLALVIRGVVRVIAGILTLDFDKAWQGVKDIFGGIGRVLGGLLRAGTAPMREAVSALGTVLIRGFHGAWEFIEELFEKGLDKLLGLFTSSLRRMATVLGASPDIPFFPDPQDLSNKINDLADSIDGYRESLHKSDDEQKTARQRTRDHVEALKDERKELRATNATTDALRRNKRQLRQAEEDLTRSTHQAGREQGKAAKQTVDWSGALRGFWRRSKDAKKGTDDLNRSVKDQSGSTTFSKGLRRMIRGSGNFEGALGRAVEFVKEATSKALKGFGAKPLDWVVEAAKGVGDLLGFARGGFIGRRGQKGKDKRLVLAGDGEAFFNGDQIPYVERALRKTYGVGLGQFFKGRRWSPHSQTRGYERGGVVDEFATGGMVDPSWDPGSERLNARISDTVGLWAKRYHADMTAGYDPGGGHISPGHNVTGTATDMVPLGGWTQAGTALFEQGLRAIEGKVDQILYGTAGIGESYPNHGRGNHAHIEWGYSPGGIGATKIPRLKVTGPRGAQREILQRAADKMVDQANAYLAKQASPVGMIAGDTGGGGSPDANRRLAHSMLLERGRGWGPWGESEWPPLNTLWTSESGFDESATNPESGAYGIPQSLPPGKMAAAGADWRTNPATQIAWGLRYIDAEYGAPSSTPLGGYDLGGVVEEFGEGGQVGKKGGGKKTKKPDPKYDVGIAEPSGPITVSSMGPLEAHLGQDGGKWVAHQEGHLASLESEYSYWDRRFNLSEEEFIVEGEDGAPTLNREAIARRVGELRQLLKIRRAIVAIRSREIAFAKRTMQLLRPVIKQLKQGLRAARSPEAKKKWRAAVESYTGQLTNWKGQLGGWSTDRKERALDVDESELQLKALAPGGSIEKEQADQYASFLEGLDSEDLTDTGEAAEPGEGAPTPAQIAEAAAAQLAEFQSQRAALFGEFGSNFVPAGTVPFQTTTQQAAGMAFYGAAGGATPTVPDLVRAATQGGGGVDINVEQHFDAPPADPHTWTKSVIFEIGAQL